MVYLIGGGTHTGKTALSQTLMRRFGCPYLSIDHLKMGLIRSGVCPLTPTSDGAALTAYLWRIVSEMVKTAVENKQSLIIEGCYIPFSWRESFTDEYLNDVKYLCLIFSERYIYSNYDNIISNANAVESRQGDDCDIETLVRDSRESLAGCEAFGCGYLLIDGEYDVSAALQMLA